MQLEHSFTVPVPPAEAWQVLLDLERVAPCMPGATLESVTGTEFAGKVKVKVGPITVTYRGTGRFTEKDQDGLRVTVEAKAKETRGTGTAAATVQARLTAAERGDTRVDVTTDLAITGKPAQFGRGVMADVGGKLIGQFAACLAEELAAPVPTPATPAAAEPTVPESAISEPAGAQPGTIRREPGSPEGLPPGIADTEPGQALGQGAGAPAEQPPMTAQPATTQSPTAQPRRAAEPINLLETAGGPVAKRLGPAAALVGLAAVLFAVRRRRHHRRSRR